ncbi:flagellar FliL protein [Paenibacillus cellulosilyticus]|uniref:Flagellar protein FliL n=1 Tax=Paenibacillus cellulosilyticus TaxID=375489 RepID=A0A2V2YXM9_9BACL|nr:flagellar basal body-associated FliL family protein [Paenibacillus cellulosilyticus]PWW06403.1 flagellar FliL protein [Paenibacillus cellulosilyticus]QKS46251.1 flagellar basal body-associated FliL family protein [Paenibacillus cellulosilyticus]
MRKMVPWLISILLAITLIAIVVVVLLNTMFDDTSKEAESTEPVKVEVLSADERVEVTSELKDIRRNLLDNDYVLIVSFAFQLDSKKSQEDFEKVKDIQIRPIINRVIADMTVDQLSGSKGQDMLSSKLLNLINQELPEDEKLVKVDITNFVMSQI